MRTRPKITNHDDEERSQEYQNILAKAENIKAKDINKVKIFKVHDNNQNIFNKDLDMSKDEISDIINNYDLTTKTINAISKVSL